MPRIIKAPYVNLDAENVFSIATPQPTQTQQPQPLIQPIDNEFDEEKARYLAESIIEEATQKAHNIESTSLIEADKILAKAKDDANAQTEKIKESARKAGYDEAYKKGEAQANKLIKEAEETLRKAKAESQQIISDVEPDMVDVIIKICEKIIGNSLSLNPEVIIYLVREGIRRTSKAGYINIHVCPEDYDTVIENKQTIMSYIGGSTELEIINDFSLQRGDCVIETPLGNVDSSLGLQLKQLLIDIRLMFENR